MERIGNEELEELVDIQVITDGEAVAIASELLAARKLAAEAAAQMDRAKSATTSPEKETAWIQTNRLEHKLVYLLREGVK